MTNTRDLSNTQELLARWSSGDRQALDDLLVHFYSDIRAIAVRELRSERHLTISATALVNEAYLRLAGLRDMQWHDRAHFMAMAARMTRRALVDEARRYRADKRSGGTPVTLSDTNLGGRDAGYDALDLDALIDELHRYDEVAAEIVSLRVFGGLTIDEAAAAMSVSAATVSRSWITGKAWLVRELTRTA